MTREEAIKILYKVKTSGEESHALVMAIKALEQEPIIDKIRAEIEHLTDTINVCYYQYVNKIDVLQIIDKYKGESEDT